MSHSAPDGSRGRATEARTARGWQIWLILAVSAAPVVAAWLAYFVWPPQSRSNYGDLVTPRPLSDPRLEVFRNQPFHLSELRGKWVLVQIDRSACDAACREKLLYMRQLRLAQGADRERIERVWLITDDGPVDSTLSREFEGTRFVRAAHSPLLDEFPPAGEIRDHIFLVDPLGNLMLRFPRHPDPNGMRRDLSRLLRASRIG